MYQAPLLRVPPQEEQPMPQEQTIQPFKVDLLREKSLILVQEYKKALEVNKNLKDKFQDTQNKKNIISKPGFFEIEMKKLQHEIETYKEALQELEFNAEFTYEEIEAEKNM